MATATDRQQIPTDHDGLVDWLRDVGPRGWTEAEKLLTAELGDSTRAMDMLEAAERELIHECAVNDHRNALGRGLGDALDGIRRALGELDELVSPSIYDVDYAEGMATADVRAFLLDAQRALRAAEALNPGRES